MATKQGKFLRSKFIVRLKTQAQFNYFMNITHFFFYVHLSLQPEDGSVNSSRDVLLCRKKVIVFLCRLTDKCDFCQGTLYINHIVVSLLRWVSGGT
jgi:hypothetical protein